MHFEDHWKGWALKIETFLGTEMATIEASAIWAQKCQDLYYCLWPVLVIFTNALGSRQYRDTCFSWRFLVPHTWYSTRFLDVNIRTRARIYIRDYTWIKLTINKLNKIKAGINWTIQDILTCIYLCTCGLHNTLYRFMSIFIMYLFCEWWLRIFYIY